jgi:SWI/SNF-related matrix-associated actin-dependent regulator of chromatin subfamily A containing DEAD/H box 1
MLSGAHEDRAFFRKLHLTYCVYDEAHMLKNMNSMRYKSLITIKSKHKLLLTGTPLQNSIVELMSLLYFVMPDIFSERIEYVHKLFTVKQLNASEDTFYKEKIQQAKGIMRPFVLRRLKSDVLKQLPKKSEHVVLCEMSKRQATEYNELISYYKAHKDEIAENGGDDDDRGGIGKGKEKKNIKFKELNSNNILMELRKAANHPLLRRCLYDEVKLKEMAKRVKKESSPDTVYEYVLEDMSVMNDFQLHKLCPLYKCLAGFELSPQVICESGKFDELARLLDQCKRDGERVLIFSQFVIMLDIIEEFLKVKAHKYCRLDGSTAIDERQELIDTYNSDSELFIFLLSTRAGGVGINLTAASVVIMHDIDYNPFNDKQAEDRCHRVGQTK